MLVLSRKENQSIIINNEIEIKIVQIKPDQVKIGINAPKNVNVLRQEIFQEITNENQQAQNKNSINNLKNVLKKNNK